MAEYDPYDETSDNGAYLGPTPGAVAPDPKLKAEWDTTLKDPKVQAFMLNAGLQMMMPSWGGAMQNIAQGIGAGAEAAGGVERIQMAQSERAEARRRADASSGRAQANIESGRKFQAEQSALDRKSREGIAASRLSGPGSLQSKSDLNAFLKEKKLILERYDLDPQYDNLDMAEKEELATVEAEEAFNRARRVTRGPGGLAAPGNSQKGALGEPLVGQSGGTETGKDNRPNLGNEQPTGGPTKPAPTEGKAKQSYDQKMSSPEGRKWLRARGYPVPEQGLKVRVPFLNYEMLLRAGKE